MSKDFPNRTDWLARRALSSAAGRYIHISAPLVTVMDNGTPRTIVGRGTTLNIGSKQRKAKTFAAKRAKKAERRAAKRYGLIEQRYEAHLNACADFDAEKIAQESEAA